MIARNQFKHNCVKKNRLSNISMITAITADSDHCLQIENLIAFIRIFADWIEIMISGTKFICTKRLVGVSNI